jgi:hypothetical protein
MGGTTSFSIVRVGAAAVGFLDRTGLADYSRAGGMEDWAGDGLVERWATGRFFSGLFGGPESLVSRGGGEGVLGAVLAWGLVGEAGEVFLGSGFAAALVVDLARAGVADSVFSFADLRTGVFSGFIIVNLGDPIENACKGAAWATNPLRNGVFVAESL